MKGALLAGAAVALPVPLQMAQAAESVARSLALGGANLPLDPKLPFKPIGASAKDDIILASGYRYDVLAAWEDDIGAGKFGYNADFTAFFPIDALDKGFDPNAVAMGFARPGMSSVDGYLLVNHEYVNPMFVSKYAGKGAKTPEQLAAEQAAVGMSIIRIKRDKSGRWAMDKTDKLNRRIDARTPMLFTGPAAKLDGGPKVVGTLANCSGGVTPWGTALSCEENFQDYPPEAPIGYGWPADPYGKKHYGWVVEVDPYDPKATPRKHTALGRMRHENVAIRVTKDGTVVAYMGDDKADSCMYKFVADKKLGPAKDRSANMAILETGKLYAADFSSGKWLLLDYDTQDALKQAKDSKDKLLFASQADVLGDARAAALALRATPVDRPEDLEIHPGDGSVYLALTNNTGHGNFHGQIVRLEETGGDPAATTFDWSLFATGGPQSGFSSPDNLLFDPDGNLWMVTDISSSRLGKGIYKFQGNNAMFFFRTSGDYAAVAYQFASGPTECEMTGPSWSPDASTMFLSVQHPGEESESLEKLSSHWPRGGKDLPRPAVVAITGFPRRA
jgi:secreted PhoX family phosphatase